MTVPITALYTVLQALIGSYLAFRAGSRRGRTGISILHADDMQLALEARRHGNWAESVPIALLLMLIVELNGASATLLHGCGVALVLARIAHPIGLETDSIANPLRAVGAGGSLLITLVLMGTALYQLVG